MTLLEAMVQLYNHDDKKKYVSFTISFPDVTRTAIIKKHWSKVLKQWNYFIKETYLPNFAYDEEKIIPAIAGISGVSLFLNMITCKVSDVEYGDAK